MGDLYLAFEQLRDIARGRSTYSSDDEWEQHLLAQLKETDDLIEKVMSED